MSEAISINTRINVGCLVSVAEMTKRELAIKDPKNFLNEYCNQISQCKLIETEKICKYVKDDLGDNVPEYCFKRYVNSEFKNQSQLENAKKRHENQPKTKEQEIKEIELELKKKPKKYVSKLRQLLKNIELTEVEMDGYLRR